MPNAKEETLRHALFLAQHLNKGDPKDGLVYILYELEMQSHNIGYLYVRNAILLLYHAPAHTLLQGIYQAVIEKVNPSASYSQLDQSMRSVIHQAHRDCEPAIWRIYFQRRQKRPSNLEFISRIKDFMELWQACIKEVSYEN